MTQKKKNILIINGHPDNESYNFALANAYKAGALRGGAVVEEIILRDLQFNPILNYGYRKRTTQEPDLEAAWKKILWADHLVFVYPVWWGSTPALLKGFIDRVFLPGFAFRKKENSLWWDKLLTGKSARIICTLDQPNWYYWLVYGSPSHRTMKRATLQYCGVNPVRITAIGPVQLSKDSYRAKWLRRMEKLGSKLL